MADVSCYEERSRTLYGVEWPDTKIGDFGLLCRSVSLPNTPLDAEILRVGLRPQPLIPLHFNELPEGILDAPF